MSDLTYLEAIVVGAFQGVTELFPVSSLGHSILVPALLGGHWAQDLDVSAPDSPYLAFIVGLHVATAAALLIFFWRDWLRIIAGFASSDGDAVSNQRLSDSRARTVLAYLVKAGADAGQFRAVGYGTARPVAPNDNDENMAKNRRIEFIVRPK